VLRRRAGHRHADRARLNVVELLVFLLLIALIVWGSIRMRGRL
jgi:hypothetical protein